MGTTVVKRSAGRTVLSAVLVLVLLAGALGVGWWAARATLVSEVPEAVEGVSAAQVVWAQASEGSVGRSLPLSTTLRQPAVPVAENTLAGVVTSISPGTVDQGEVVYAIGDVPVRVAQGEVPFWRELTRDVEGADVEALQRLLIVEGHLAGDVDGDFGQSTEDAVKVWQRAQDREETGTVPLGELIAVRTLPAVIQLGDELVVGQSVTGGEDSVLAPTGEREFVLVVTADQARLIPAESTVEVSFEDLLWDAVIDGSAQDESGSTVFTLSAPDGGEVCGQDCDRLPSDAQVTLSSRVIVVPEVSGLTVPAAALRTGTDGSTYVETESGHVRVTVNGSGQGVVVIEGEGIAEGTRVRVSGEVSDQAPADQVEPQQPSPGDDSDTTQDG